MPKNFEYRVSRRDFLKLAAVATAGAMIPSALLSPVFQNSIAKAQAPVSNGLRGQSFNANWKFNQGDVSNGQSTSFNDSGWRSLNVPHDWSIELPFNQSSASGASGGYLDGGIGWYRKTFTLDSSYAGKRIFIQFDGAYMNSQVWINGTSLGTRPYGYTTFEYEITPYVNFGATTNVIAVRLNNNQPTSRWYSGSGIYRNVWLNVLNPVHVTNSGVFVTTPSVSASAGTVSVSSEVQNQSSASQPVTLVTTIYNPSGGVVTSNTTAVSNIGANAVSTFNQSFSVSNPQLWSPTTPNLYQVQVEVKVGGATVDTYLSPLGFRWYSFSNTTGMTFNGSSLKLRGMCNHHDLGSLGAAFNYRALERQLQILKGMGVNALRTSHNPPAPEFLELADRLGFMVMDEAFDCWESGKVSNDYHLYFSQWAQADIQAMVRRDRNHPSVILWSIGNEIPNPTVTTGTNLRNWVRAVDSTRPVTWNTMDVLGSSGAAVSDILDVQGWSYNSWQYDAGHSQHPNWKIFGSESSSAVRSRGVYHTPTNQNVLTSGDTQCSSYDNSWPSWAGSAENVYNDDNTRAWIGGEFVWTGFDYIGEPTPYSWPAKSSYFGVMDTCGFPKDIYYFYKSRWTTSPLVHILPHWNWSSGTTVTVFVYSNCTSVELFLNGASLGTKTFSGTARHLEWSVPWASGTLSAKGSINGSVVANDQVVTAGAANKLALSVDRSAIQGDGVDLAYVTTDIRDANGNFVPTANNTVNFSISGPGKLVGVDNGNPISHESYQGTSRTAFNGKCLAIIQSTGAGTITLTASASGLTGASVNINAQAVATATPIFTPTIGPSPTPTNTPVPSLAQGKTASTDSAETANPAVNGNDGNTSTRWCAADGNANHWWKVDLGASFNLSGSEVMWEFARNYKYKVEVSTDNTNWTMAADKTASTNAAQTQTDSFSVTARYVRITVTGLPTSPVTWASFFEFRVFGSGGPTNTPTNTPVATNTPTQTPTPNGSFPVPGMYYRLINRTSGKVLEVANSSTADGGNVQQWTSTGGTNQQWSFVSLGNGYYEIINRNSGKALDVVGNGTADGVNVDQWTWNSGNNQQWTLVALTGGYYKLINRNSGKALDVVGNGTADGVNVDQWTDNGGNNQQWQIIQ